MVAVFVILKKNYQIPYKMSKEILEGTKKINIELAQEVTFLNKASILKTLAGIPENTKVIIDASKTNYMHYDVEEIIKNFEISTESKNIHLEIIDLHAHKVDYPPEHIKMLIENNNNYKNTNKRNTRSNYAKKSVGNIN